MGKIYAYIFCGENVAKKNILHILRFVEDLEINQTAALFQNGFQFFSFALAVTYF